ncbi:MAG: SRPBCC domain-containing protein [Acidobacteria bacterium]|nr:SRPBCC domain-containing protein [Acidobacteriota bacterium]MBV9476754.1 SRPBCC domain-containing protein [Acidobacteriota bacterium]
MSDETKTLNLEIALDADAETVWRAVSEGEELKRWFPLDARVTPGVGGAVWCSFGGGMDWETPIEVWEPNHHLRTADPPPSGIAVDYFIEARGGETVLRIVQSGFAAAGWDDELIETAQGGWRSFLATLRHYLRFHRGEPRTMAYVRHDAVPLSRPEAFQRMLTAFGFVPAELREGGRFDVTAANGDRFTGVIDVLNPPMHLSGSFENHGNAFFMIEIEPGKERCRPAIWVSLYGEAGREAPALQARLRELVVSTFGR